MFRLNCIKNKKIYTYEFNTITEAYHYYLKHFSTIGDWFYYLRVAHNLLSKVTDEEVMMAIFNNVFHYGCLYKERR